MAARRWTAEEEQIIEATGRIDGRRLRGVDRFGIVVVHLFKFACALPVGCGEITNNGNWPEVASNHPKSLARVAREKSQPQEGDLAGLCDEKERQGSRSLQRR